MSAARNDSTRALTRRDMARGLREAGLQTGDVVLVHSAMRTFGPVEGGPATVVESMLEVIGTGGTLVVPAFTFAHEAETDPIIDPANDPSEMGIITETVRRRPDALRSTAFRHSFAAVGRRAEVITSVNPALSSFDLRSSFGVMLALEAKVLLLGVTYDTSTSHHFAEWVCDVPYRHTIEKRVRVRGPDGSIVKQTMVDYQPRPSADGSYYGPRHTDFNRLGRMLEERGVVGTTAIGNGAGRCFPMRDLIDLAQVEAARDHNVFRCEEGKAQEFTPLEFGQIIISPTMEDGAGRPVQYQWCVMDPRKLRMPELRRRDR